MKSNLLTLVVMLVSIYGFSQQNITWEDLAKVKFTEKYIPAYDEFFLHPEFSTSVKALEGKKLSIKGYFLNMDADSGLFILSKGPMSSCFFCGQGGPETAIELIFTNIPKFKTDEVVSITGVLRLNQADVEHFNYILEGCTGKLLN